MNIFQEYSLCNELMKISPENMLANNYHGATFIHWDTDTMHVCAANTRPLIYSALISNKTDNNRIALFSGPHAYKLFKYGQRYLGQKHR